MAEGVVDLLKLIQVHHQERKIKTSFFVRTEEKTADEIEKDSAKLKFKIMINPSFIDFGIPKHEFCSAIISCNDKIFTLFHDASGYHQSYIPDYGHTKEHSHMISNGFVKEELWDIHVVEISEDPIGFLYKKGISFTTIKDFEC